MATSLSSADTSQPPLAHRAAPTKHGAGPEVSSSPSDPAILKHLYATMLRCRMIEASMQELAQARGVSTPGSSELGSEAISIGSMVELCPGDAISGRPTVATGVICGSSLGLMYADMLQLRAEYLAFAPDAAHSTIHLLPSTASVESQLNIAAGFALAAKLEEHRAVVVAHLEDGFNALGFWHEAAKLAASERLPIIFVATRRLAGANAAGGSELRDRATAYGIPGITVDGNDVVAMWRVTQESIHRARGGTGPTLIDAELLPVKLTTRGQVDANDPLHRMQHYLEKRNHWDAGWKRGLEKKFTSEIEEAQSFFRESKRKR